MRFTIGLIFMLLSAGSQALGEPENWQPPVPMELLQAARTALIPFPQQVTWQSEDWIVPADVAVMGVGNQPPLVSSAVERLVAELAKAHIVANTQADSGANGIRIAITPGVVTTAEGYHLEVNTSGVVLEGTDAAGVLYGVETLRQLMRPEKDGVHVQKCSIHDWPAFGIRGFMHDVGRNFQTIDSLKGQLSRFAEYKINTFHWHLTDSPAWRIECHAYPELNDARFQTRDPGQFYSYAQMRDLIGFADQLHIRIIPELDMPGHSNYFKRALGCSMDSEKGMVILEKLIDEFCAEIPAASCPILHLGSDEVRIKNPGQFIARMTARVRANHREVMIWNPGLTGDGNTINQLWIGSIAARFETAPSAPFVDSAGGYLNALDPLRTVSRYYFRQLCQRTTGGNNARGAILCCWPDVRVDDKTNVLRYNAVWPGALSFAEAVWHGRPTDAPQYRGHLPDAGSAALDNYREFEDRLAIHRDRYFADDPFPFVKTTQVDWKIVGPFLPDAKTTGDFSFEPEREIKSEYQADGHSLKWISAVGASIHLAGRGEPGVIAEKQRISTVYALTYAKVDSDRTISAWIGFETPERSNHQSGGIPPAGKWCPFGGTVFVNDVELPAPVWKSPGANQSLKPAWGSAMNEVPFTDEDFYWTRPPTAVPMHRGWNKILLRIPCGYADQNWDFTFVAVRKNQTHWVEDESVRISSVRATE